MRTSRNKQNQNRGQNRSKQFRAKAGQRMVQNMNVKVNNQRRYFNGVSPLNRDNSETAYSNNNTYHQRGLAHQQRTKVSQGQNRQGSYQWKQKNKGQAQNSVSGSSSVVQDDSFQTAAAVRGRLKSNFGFMRSDSVARKQQLKHELMKLHVVQLQQQQLEQQQLQQKQRQLKQQQKWVQKSLRQLQTDVSQQQQSSARTAIYEPSVSTSVRVHIPNTESSSDVSVVFGKKSRKARQASAAASRSVAFYQQEGKSRQKPVQARRQSDSLVSFEDDVNPEIVDEDMLGGTAGTNTRGSYSDVDVLIV